MAIEEDQSKTCVVLGGRSFIGRCLVVRLLKIGNWIVRVADSAQSLQLDPSESKYDSPLNLAFSTGRASYAHVDVRHKSTIINAIEGSEVVFYMDDLDSCNYDFYFGYAIIVQGAKNVVNACRRCKVKRLIYNSTADVVFDNSHDIHSGNETLLYSSKFKNLYSELKAQAEALVLLANDIDGLLTCALRPSNVLGLETRFSCHLLSKLQNLVGQRWYTTTGFVSGSYDWRISYTFACHSKLLCRTLAEWSSPARPRRLAPSFPCGGRPGQQPGFIGGSDQTISDFTYVDNVAHALVCAEVALTSHMLIVSGKVFFITNFEPARSWQFALCMLEGLGYYRPIIKLPVVVVRLIVFLIKWMHSNMNSRDFKHVSVHNVVQLMSHTRTYNCSAAERHIEYAPIVSLDDGITLTVKSFTHLAKDLPSTRVGDLIEQSKMEELLGSGEVAGILLWRDERRSFLWFLGVAFLYYWFCVCERGIISSTAKLVVVIMVLYSGYARLLPKAYGCGRMSPKGSVLRRLPCFEVSEICMRSCVSSVAKIWNGGVHVARLLAEGKDWSLFFKVVACIYLFKLLVVNFLPTSLGIGLGFSFIFFFVYEQYDVEIDGVLGIVLEMIWQSVLCVTSCIPMPLPPPPLCINTAKPTKSKDQR